VVRVLSIVAIVAVIALSAFVRTPVVPRSPLARPPVPAVALAALAQPLAAPTTLAPMPPQDPLTQQINFHIAFVGDFLATGAALFGRQFAIPGTLLQNIQRGTAIPDALGRALVDFTQVELDAGRELVRFAVQYVQFQVGFVANILHDVVTFVMAIPTAINAFLGGMTPQPLTMPDAPTQTVSLSAARLSQTTEAVTTDASTSRTTLAAASSNNDGRKNGEHTETAPATATASATQKKPKEVVAADDSATVATVSTKGEVKSATTEPGETDRASAVDRTSDVHQTAAHEPPHKHDATHDASDRKDAATPSKRDDSVR
jgi:hypothetical protein